MRDQLTTRPLLDKWVTFMISAIAEINEILKKPSGDPTYRPQYVFELAKDHWELMLLRYSRGDAVRELAQYIPPMLDAWEESNRLHLEIRTEQELWERRDWSTNLDHYIVCFWLVGFALTLEIPDADWRRLLVLIGNEGKDALLDRVIASRELNRQIGTQLCHPKPYQRLLKAIDAPAAKQASLLKDFVDHWYAELDRPAKRGMPAMYRRPYWYKYNDNLEGGAYFGFWCVEAAAVVKAFGLDDSLCLGHPNYPGDLLRPDQAPSDTPEPVVVDTSASRHDATEPLRTTWWRRLLGI